MHSVRNRKCFHREANNCLLFTAIFVLGQGSWVHAHQLLESLWAWHFTLAFHLHYELFLYLQWKTILTLSHKSPSLFGDPTWLCCMSAVQNTLNLNKYTFMESLWLRLNSQADRSRPQFSQSFINHLKWQPPLSCFRVDNLFQKAPFSTCVRGCMLKIEREQNTKRLVKVTKKLN